MLAACFNRPPVRVLCDCFRSRRRAEILVLRHPLQQRSPRRRQLRWTDRAVFVWLSGCPHDAAELKGAGLKQVAAILTDLSSSALPMTDWQFCCYSADVPANRVSAQRQRQAQRAEKRKQWSLPPRGPRKPKVKPF
jgi:hypothetical protein